MNSRELQRPEIHEYFQPLNFCSYYCEASFPKEISKCFRDCCKDTRKFYSLFVALNFSSAPNFYFGSPSWPSGLT